jgi:hypothetical protein
VRFRSTLVDNFQLGTAIFFMFFDAVLYVVLAWYLDNVLPKEWGELSIQNHLFLLCCARAEPSSFDLLNCPARAINIAFKSFW